MTAIDWSRVPRTGIAIIDGQHRNLVLTVNELTAAVEEGRGGETLRKILSNLRLYAQYHFSTEEQLLSRHSWPGLAEHKKHHARFVEALDEFDFEALLDAPDAAADLLFFLQDWLENHLGTEDVGFSTYLKQAGVS